VTDVPVKIRDATAADWPFMATAWRSSFFNLGWGVRGADKQHYFDEMTRLFAAIAPTASARIACDPTDDGVQIGFACYTGTKLHFVYVMQDFRREGLVPSMLEGLPIKHYTFMTTPGVKRLKPADRGWQFTPCFTFH
jgi:hypothetical protein